MMFYPDYIPIGGVIMQFFMFFLLFGIAAYIYSAIALMTIAKRTKTKNGWLAWIPIANLYLMTQIAKVQWWTMFVIILAFIPFLNSLAGIATAGVSIWWWWKISERLHKPGWLGILMIIPVANFIVLGVLAWGK